MDFSPKKHHEKLERKIMGTRGRLTMFLIALVSLIVLGPILSRILGPIMITILITIVMFFGANTAIGENPGRRKRIFSFLLLAIIFSWTYTAFSFEWLLILKILSVSAFFGLITYHILKYIMSTKKVDQDIIMGAVAVYIMIALVFSIVYIGMEQIDPGSFRMPPDESNTNVFFYFSMVTMTTLGYGDITPISPIAQSFVMLQVLLGIFFMAILLARLLGKMEIS